MPSHSTIVLWYDDTSIIIFIASTPVIVYCSNWACLFTYNSLVLIHSRTPDGTEEVFEYCTSLFELIVLNYLCKALHGNVVPVAVSILLCSVINYNLVDNSC